MSVGISLFHTNSRRKRRFGLSKNLKKQLIKCLLVISIFAIFGWTLTTLTHLGECASDSLQGFKYVLFLKSSFFQKGDIILIRDHRTKYLGNLTFTKRILGMPGDFLTQDKEGICVFSLTQKDKPLETKSSPCISGFCTSSKVDVLPLLAQTKDGKPLTPQSVQIIPEGHVFVAGDHPRSFDSRYEEFGLVPLEKVWGKGVFTW